MVAPKGDSILGELIKNGKQGAATQATLNALGVEMRGFAEGTNRRLENLEKRMATTETKNSVQGHEIEDLKEQLDKQGKAIKTLIDNQQSLKTQMAINAAIAGIVGAVIGAVLIAVAVEVIVPLLTGG